MADRCPPFFGAFFSEALGAIATVMVKVSGMANEEGYSNLSRSMSRYTDCVCNVSRPVDLMNGCCHLSKSQEMCIIASNIRLIRRNARDRPIDKTTLKQ